MDSNVDLLIGRTWSVCHGSIIYFFPFLGGGSAEMWDTDSTMLCLLADSKWMGWYGVGIRLPVIHGRRKLVSSSIWPKQLNIFLWLRQWAWLNKRGTCVSRWLENVGRRCFFSFSTSSADTIFHQILLSCVAISGRHHHQLEGLIIIPSLLPLAAISMAVCGDSLVWAASPLTFLFYLYLWVLIVLL